MQFSELETSLTNGIMPIYQIYGKDAFLRETALKMLKDNGLSEPDLNLTNYQGVDVLKEPDDFLTAVKSYPFLSDKRYIVIYDYYPNAKEVSSKRLSSVFNTPEETSVVIFVNEKKCEALFKHKNVTSIDCDRASVGFIAKFIRKEALKSNVIIGTQAVSKIIEYTSGDMSKIVGEVNKLVSFVGENNEITESVVDGVISKDLDFEVYELSGFIADLKYDEAFFTLKEMLSKNQDKQILFITIYYHFRRLLHSAISSLSESELAESLGVKEFAVRKYKAQARKFTPVKLKSICDKLASFDGAFKCGDISVDSALWNSIFNVLIN